MTIYVVVSSFGSWEDYRKINEEAFYKKEDAEKCVLSLTNEYTQSDTPPYPALEYDNLSEEQQEEYDKWESLFF